MTDNEHTAESDVLDVLRRHSIGAFNGSQVTCSHCRHWMTNDEYRQHLATLVVRVLSPGTSEGGAA